ncbi:hypothetical protein ACMFCX_15795 [Klebsiella pneumoniae]
MRLYQAARCDYLIAFGGGSPIDTAQSDKNPHRKPRLLHRLLRRRQSEKRWRAAGGHQPPPPARRRR